MATWVGANTNLRFELSQSCVTDGANIYGNSLTETAIKMYSPLGGDTLTTISNGLVASGTLRWFRGRLYALRSGNGNIYIHRWNGGQSWSLVHTVSPALIEAAGVLVYTPITLGWTDFMTDGKYLVVVQDYYGDDPAITSADEHGVYVSYTIDGASWGQGSINVTNNFIIPYSENRSHFIGTPYHPAEIGLATVIRTASNTDKVFRFVNGQLQEKASVISGTLYYAFSDRKYFWRRDTPQSQGAPNEDNVAYSTDLANWTATTIHIVPIRNNCLAPVGYGVDTTLNQIDLYLWDGADWVLSPGDPNGVSGTVVDLGNNHVHNFIRLKDGTCFAFVTVDSSVDAGFWKVRSDPLGGPGRPPEETPYAAARFYSGEESLIERSQLPFSEVGPGGLDVRGDRIAAVGNHQPGQPVVALASAETDFSDWLDHSGSVPTDGQVTSLRWVIPGTVTDGQNYIIS